MDGAQTVDLGQYLAAQDDPFVGQVFEERYRIDAVLGRGGFGAVYRAEQLAVGRPVAIKLLHAHHADDQKEVERFQREARAIAALRHPNIVQVHDFGRTHEGFLYLVMECLEGHTFKHIIRHEAPLEPERVVNYLIQALDGLAEAHARGVIHRDLKPENIFCATIGRRKDVIKLLDFGVAKILDEQGHLATLTGKGMAVGSPRYMSPEQAQAQPVSPQTDLYLIGLITYELLTGRPVFECQGSTEYLLAHIRQPPPPPVREGVALTGPLVDLVMACLAKSPEDRPKSAEALMADVEACRGSALDTSRQNPDLIKTVTDRAAAQYVGLPEAARMSHSSALRATRPPPPLPSRPRGERPPTLRPTKRPPLPPTINERPGLQALVSAEKGPLLSPFHVFLAVFATVLLLGGVAIFHWFDRGPSTHEGGMLQEQARPPSRVSPHVVDPGQSKANADDERACTASGDCPDGATCVDGRCEAD